MAKDTGRAAPTRRSQLFGPDGPETGPVLVSGSKRNPASIARVSQDQSGARVGRRNSGGRPEAGRKDAARAVEAVSRQEFSNSIGQDAAPRPGQADTGRCWRHCRTLSPNTKNTTVMKVALLAVVAGAGRLQGRGDRVHAGYRGPDEAVRSTASAVLTGLSEANAGAVRANAVATMVYAVVTTGVGGAGPWHGRPPNGCSTPPWRPTRIGLVVIAIVGARRRPRAGLEELGDVPEDR